MADPRIRAFISPDDNTGLSDMVRKTILAAGSLFMISLLQLLWTLGASAHTYAFVQPPRPRSMWSLSKLEEDKPEEDHSFWEVQVMGIWPRIGSNFPQFEDQFYLEVFRWVTAVAHVLLLLGAFSTP